MADLPTLDSGRRYAGTIVRLVKGTAFGFAEVLIDGHPREIFVHTSNCVDSFEQFAEGQGITCGVQSTAKGLRATEVRRA